MGISKLSMVLIVIGFAICSNIEAWGADWEILSSDDAGDTFLYDKGGITRTSDNHLKVWTKVLYSEKSILKKVEKFGEKFVNLSYELTLQDIDCKNKKQRFLSIIDYSKDGGVIYSGNEPNAGWNFVPPESLMEDLYRKVCK